MHSLRNISTKFQFDGQLINADSLNTNLAVNCVELGCRCFSFGNQHIVPALDLTLSLQVPAHCHDGAVGL